MNSANGHFVTLDGVTIRPALALGGWVAFKPMHGQAMAMGEIRFLSPGEIDKIIARTGPYSINRAWENWCRRADRPVTATEDA